MHKQGIYHYRPDKSVIELISEVNLMDTIREIVYAEPVINIKNCSCVMFITSVFNRVLIKYGERGYRFILQEVGGVTQNISLVCEALGLSLCMVGSYIDEKVNTLLEVDGTLESVQSVMVIGKKESF